MTFDERAFRDVVGRFATGVAVVGLTVDGEPHAMTANAFASLSLEPFLVLVCVDRASVTHGLLARTDTFAVSILGRHQEELSVRFADRERRRGPAQFAGVAWHLGTTGAPLIDDAIAWVECEVWATYPGGDHDIVVGRVVAAAAGEDRGPLVYFRSSYRRLE